ncbi:MAG: YkgJ family cysteine cluster protein, partial [Desulfuromonadaceae bacterium]
MESPNQPHSARWSQLKEELRQQQARFDREVQQDLDRYTQQGGRIFCGKGCQNCCTLTVNASLSEALRVTEALPESQPQLEDYILQLRQVLPEAADLKHYLKLQRSRLGACPFLDDAGSCTVYQVRPFACRALLSTRPADWCGVDFSTLTALDKQLFLSSLDPSVVDFPTQYLATPRETGQQLEGAAVT